MSVNNSALIIGQPDSGKTTYLAQFLTRVTRKKSRITLSKMPENIKAISDAQKRLASGEEPIPTNADVNVELHIPVLIKDKQVDINCPDYGGEQVSACIDLMEVDTKWEKITQNSDHWLLFIRAGKISPEYDLSVSSYEKVEIDSSNKKTTIGLSEQSKLIELLQFLLHVKKVGVKKNISSPKLTVVITCWDELNTESSPREVLAEKLPLLNNFIETVWDHKCFGLFGVAAQEFPLKSQDAKDKFIDECPENFGYMVTPEGVKDKDLTKLIEKALYL